LYNYSIDLVVRNLQIRIIVNITPTESIHAGYVDGDEDAIGSDSGGSSGGMVGATVGLGVNVTCGAASSSGLSFISKRNLMIA
jgi:hypothetical protein